METRLIVAYALILVMAAGLASLIFYATRERRAHGRAHRRSRQRKRTAQPGSETGA